MVKNAVTIRLSYSLVFVKYSLYTDSVHDIAEMEKIFCA